MLFLDKQCLNVFCFLVVIITNDDRDDDNDQQIEPEQKKNEKNLNDRFSEIELFQESSLVCVCD